MLRASRRRRLAVIAAIGGVAVLLLATSCGTIGVFVDLQGELEEAGFDNIEVNIDSGDSSGDSLRISADAPPSLGVEAAQSSAAEITWKTFGRRFDQLSVSIDGNRRPYERAELEQMFGARPEGLDDKELGDDIRRIGVGVIIALIVGTILCIGLLAFVLIMVSRSRRRKRAAQWTGQPWAAPGPPGYPPPGYPPPVTPHPAIPRLGVLPPGSRHRRRRRRRPNHRRPRPRRAGSDGVG